MNTACIIAACAANARRNNEQHKTENFLRGIHSEIYYKVKFRMYIDFEKVRIPVCSNNALFSDIDIRPMTFAKEYIFSISSNKCVNGIDKYIDDNLERFTSSEVWEFTRKDIVKMYIDTVKRDYNVGIDGYGIHYSIRYAWHVEV